MKRFQNWVLFLTIVLCTSFLAYSQSGVGGGQSNVGGGGGGIGTFTVATLPTNPSTNTVAIVTDGNGSSCTSGGGSTRVLCQYNGTIWVVISGGGGGGAAFSAITSGTNTTAAMIVGSGGTLDVPTQGVTDNDTSAASTAFVTTAISNAIAGVNPAVAVQAATTAASDTSGMTYNNGVAGIGATLTGSVNTAVTIDGFTFTAAGQRLLVKNDTQSPSGAFNGVYFLTVLQTGILAPVFTRALDYDMPSDINNTGAIPVVNGTVNSTTTWVITSTVNTVGTDPLTFVQFSFKVPALPTTPNGVPQVLSSTPSGGVGGALAFSLSGVPFDAQVNPGGNAYTIPATDRSSLLTLSNASATAITLPQANSTGFGSNFSFADLNLGAGLETITPTTSTINGAASQIIPANWFGIEYSDNTNYRMPVLPTISAFPDCQDSAGNHLNFTAATGALACGTSAGPSLLTSAPPWLRFFGDGSDGAINISGSTGSYNTIHQATTFTCSNTITTTASSGITSSIIIMATTSITLNAGCLINNNGAAQTGANNGDIGGAGGGGGGGAASGTAGQANLIPRNGAFASGTNAGAAGTAGASSGGNGGNGGSPIANYQKAYLQMPPYSPQFLAGGGKGGAGGSSGGAAGSGAGVVILVAPTITIASGVIIDSGGQQGTCAAANSTGAGGGGGAGVVLIAAKTFTDSGGTYNVTGGPGGCNANPQVLLCVPGMAVTGATCPGTAPVGVPAFTTGAVAHVSTFSGGNPTVVTVDTAGAGYNFTPGCLIVGTGGGANTGSGATCTVTMSAGTVSSISVSGGNGGYGTGTTFTTAGLGGYGGSGWEKSVTIQ